MFLLSNDLISGLSDASPKSSMPVKGGTLCLYLGETSNTLRDHGLLNVVLWGDDSNAFGFDMADLESCHRKIKFRERMKRLNSSEIVGLSQGDGKIYFQHWTSLRSSWMLAGWKSLTRNLLNKIIQSLANFFAVALSAQLLRTVMSHVHSPRSLSLRFASVQRFALARRSERGD